jgi:hypothetical protein
MTATGIEGPAKPRLGRKREDGGLEMRQTAEENGARIL